MAKVIAFQDFKNQVINDYQKYLINREIKPLANGLPKTQKQFQDINRVAENYLTANVLRTPNVVGSDRYNYFGQGKKRVYHRKPEEPAAPKFTASRFPTIDTYGVRNHFSKIGQVTNPIYTRKTKEIRERGARDAAMTLNAKDVSQPGKVNIPQSQYEINMTARDLKSILPNTVRHKRQNTNRGALTSKPTTGYKIINVPRVFIDSENRFNNSERERVRGFLSVSKRKRGLEFEAGKTRGVIRQGIQKGEIAPPTLIQTSKFEARNDPPKRFTPFRKNVSHNINTGHRVDNVIFKKSQRLHDLKAEKARGKKKNYGNQIQDKPHITEVKAHPVLVNQRKVLTRIGYKNSERGNALQQDGVLNYDHSKRESRPNTARYHAAVRPSLTTVKATTKGSISGRNPIATLAPSLHSVANVVATLD